MKGELVDIVVKTFLGLATLAAATLPVVGLMWLLLNVPVVFMIIVILALAFAIGNELF